MTTIANPVEEYLSKNTHKKLSVKSLSNRLELKRRVIVYLIHHSLKIREVNPLEVGSMKTVSGVYTYAG